VGGTYLFIEALEFTSVVKDYFGSDETYAEFQSDLVGRPEAGKVIAGASPLRKIRWGDRRRGTGKRGGLRVVYIHIPDVRILFLIDVYGKDETDDLTRAEKKTLQDLANRVVKELRARYKEPIA